MSAEGRIEIETRDLMAKTMEKARKHSGDPFTEYRKKGVLPEEFEYGMNCLLDRLCELCGWEITQEVYTELRHDPEIRIIKSMTAKDKGIPVLIGGISLEKFTKAPEKAKERIMQQFIQERFFFNLGTLVKTINDKISPVQREKAGFTCVGLDIRSFNVLSIMFSDRIQGNMIFWRSDNGDYFDNLVFECHDKDGYLHNKLTDRKMKFNPGSLDEEVVVMIPKKDKSLKFRAGRELLPEEMAAINFVYRYIGDKPAYEGEEGTFILDGGGKSFHIVKDKN